MNSEIAVRLPTGLVAYVDELVSAGEPSRAAVVMKALRRYRRQLLAERDAEIYASEGGYPDLGGWDDRPVPEPD